MFFHASQTPNIDILLPNVSNHNKSLVYLSTKRDNTLVYLSNAVEKFCRENNILHKGKYIKWASYGFANDGILQLDEYYPNATIETYKGISGYIYSADEIFDYKNQDDIPNAIITSKPVPVSNCQYIIDAYDEILKAVQNGSIKLNKFEDNSPEKLNWIKRTITLEYEKYYDYQEYKEFLKAKFQFL